MPSDDKSVRNTSSLGNVGVGIAKNATVTIGSDVGDLIGALNDGARIQVQGSAGKYAADGMTSGEVTINGDADDGAGAAMSGGTLIIKGNAKNHVGQLLKGGTIIVEGSVRHYVGSFMIAGTIIIGGDSGRDLGSSMMGGTIYVHGNHETLSANLLQTELTEEDVEFLEGLLKKYNLNLNGRKFTKIITRPKTMTLIQDNMKVGTIEYANEFAVGRHKHKELFPDVVKSNLISTLHDIQAKCGYVPEEKIREVAQKFEIPVTDVYGVVTFYKSFNLAPRGRHSITVCEGTACHVRSSARVLQRICEILQIEPGETTEDQDFSLEAVNCLGCCALGPMVVIDGKHHGLMNTTKVDALLRNYGKVTRKVPQLQAPVQAQRIRGRGTPW
jgi:NADH:ubiquinone oxidoreductase subunit E/formylmethanofuran dehydrogenase subunit C